MSDWNKRTKLVHGGVRRSQYNEVSEAIFLTQGFVYDNAVFTGNVLPPATIETSTLFKIFVVKYPPQAFGI